MHTIKLYFHELRSFLLLWSTQSLSALGSGMTGFALIIWSYEQQGSALTTALLSVCSYGPYVMMSIFAGALSDRWDKKITMLVCDSFAALCTVITFVLLKTGNLEIWHLYGLNALNGLMNTIQQPASDVTITLLVPQEHYQKVSGLRSFSNSLVNILTPVIATAILTLGSLEAVLTLDLITFLTAFFTLLISVKIPNMNRNNGQRETVWQSARTGLQYLKNNRGILDLILFLAAINLVASVYNAALPAMVLSRNGGSEMALGILNTVTGLAMMAGSVIASLMPKPKSRVKVILHSLLFSMSTENFFLALGRSAGVWCLGAVLGWICIPVMNTNMDVLLRSRIPLEMQGRVYSARNTLQFFTIPVGYFLGGFLVDRIFEPFMAQRAPESLLLTMFGEGKGSGAALLFFVLAFAGILVCLIFRKDPHIWGLEE